MVNLLLPFSDSKGYLATVFPRLRASVKSIRAPVKSLRASVKINFRGYTSRYEYTFNVFFHTPLIDTKNIGNSRRQFAQFAV